MAGSRSVLSVFLCRIFTETYTMRVKAGELGFEPRYEASKTPVLPLDDSPLMHTVGVEPT